MTNQSAGFDQVVVDEYLDSVERALIASGAPRSERTQVVQDLELQIAEMLAALPQPATEESLRSVIARLEPPAHFAATYGNGGKRVEESMASVAGWSRPMIDWAYLATVGSGMILLSAIFFLMAANAGNDGLAWLMLLTVIASSAFTPYALVRVSREQDTAAPVGPRKLMVMVAAMGYCVVVPVVIISAAVVVTRGAVLTALGAVAFVYLEYVLTRWIYGKFGGPEVRRESCPPLATRICAPSGA